MNAENTFPQPVEVQSLKRGGIYALIYPKALLQVQLHNLREALREFEAKHGITFIVFDEAMRIAKIEEPKFLDEEVPAA